MDQCYLFTFVKKIQLNVTSNKCFWCLIEARFRNCFWSKQYVEIILKPVFLTSKCKHTLFWMNFYWYFLQRKTRNNTFKYFGASSDQSCQSPQQTLIILSSMFLMIHDPMYKSFGSNRGNILNWFFVLYFLWNKNKISCNLDLLSKRFTIIYVKPCNKENYSWQL